MPSSKVDSSDLLERGDIFFFYRPRVDEETPEGLTDVQRFFIVLRPDQQDMHRLLVVGRKRLPRAASHERLWGFVDKVDCSAASIRDELAEATYETRTRGVRHRPSARPAGEGVYAITLTAGQLHLSYALALPEAPDEVQRELEIAPEASFVLSIKNPEAGAPPGLGLNEEAQADFPSRLQREFRGRRFEGEDLRMLDYEGAEFILVGASEAPEADYGPGVERALSGKRRPPDPVRDLGLDPRRHPLKPLFEGEWA